MKIAKRVIIILAFLVVATLGALVGVTALAIFNALAATAARDLFVP